MSKNDNLISQSIDQIMDDRFGRYAKYVIQQRALPDARDGLKPVQRRILYSMYELNLHFDKPFKKSARVVGDVIGKYHPHGDSSIYEAMVRMSQSWKMNIPLVQMHGNIGSIDDDPAAAMRYTEARLSKISQLMLIDLAKKSVKFAPNFDDSEKEPTVLPSLIPNLLVNGTRGIAAGFATEMPPHNLGEVLDATIAKIRKPDINLKQLTKYIKGPDFPTGGIIYGGDGILTAFERGQGRIILVSKKIETKDKNFQYIEVNEIPYGVVKSKLVYDIDTIIQNQAIDGLMEVKDQSDREGISILIKMSANANTDTIWKYLLNKTDLQVYYSYNNVAIVDNAPKLLGLNQLLDSYIYHLIDVKIATIKFDLDKFYKRLEIVEGFIKVAKMLNEVIKTIREANNSRAGVISALEEQYQFTKNQAIAIADMRLYRLSHTDQDLYLKEQFELKERIKFLNELLIDRDLFNGWLIDIIKDIKKEFATSRKSIIEQEETFTTTYNEVDLVKTEPCYVGISSDGYLKRFSTNIHDSNKISTYKLKEHDYLIYLNRVSTTTNLLIFTDLGRYALIPVYKIAEAKWRDLGIHFSELVDYGAQESIINIIAVDDFDISGYIVLATKQGMTKRIELKELLTTRYTNLLIAIKLKKHDYLQNACLSNGKLDVLFVTKKGLAAKYSETDIPIYGTRTQGVKAFNLQDDDHIVSVGVIDEYYDVLMYTDKYYVKRIKHSDIVYSSRKQVAKQVFLQKKSNPYLVTDIKMVSKDSVMLLKQAEETYQYKVTEINLTTPNEGFKKIKDYDVIGLSVIENTIANAESDLFNDSIKTKVEKAQEDDIQFTSAANKVLELDEMMNIDEMIRKINQNLKKKSDK